jgi:hypothetical protein
MRATARVYWRSWRPGFRRQSACRLAALADTQRYFGCRECSVADTDKVGEWLAVNVSPVGKARPASRGARPRLAV